MQDIKRNVKNIYLKTLKARIQIARIGEKDKYNWWDVEAQSEGGLYALKRLFKNTYHWAAMEISMRSAISKIEGLMKESNNYFHLFNLTPEINSKIWNLFFQLKRENENPESYFLEINNEDYIFDKIIKNFEIYHDILEKIRNAQKDLINRSILVLGTLKKEDLDKIEKNKEVVKLLIAGFTLGSNNKLIIPTYRIT
ncbi:MAG: BrxE family protein, partial [Candidatus Thorarchaeota archaeon]